MRCCWPASAPSADGPPAWPAAHSGTGNALGVMLRVGGAEKLVWKERRVRSKLQREDARAAWLLTARALAEMGACGSLYSWLPNHACATISPATKSPHCCAPPRKSAPRRTQPRDDPHRLPAWAARLRAREPARERPRSRVRHDLLPAREGLALEPASDETGRSRGVGEGVGTTQAGGKRVRVSVGARGAHKPQRILARRCPRGRARRPAGEGRGVQNYERGSGGRMAAWARCHRCYPFC